MRASRAFGARWPGNACTGAGIPKWAFGAFMLGSVCSIATVLVSVISTPENVPSDAELAALKQQKGGGLGTFFREIGEAVKDMPTPMKVLALVYFFQWYAMNCYWQFISLAISKILYGTTDTTSALYQEAVAQTGRVNATYNIVTFCVAFSLVALAKKLGAKWVHAICLWCATVGLMVFPHMTNQWTQLVAIVGQSGSSAWASPGHRSWAFPTS